MDGASLTVTVRLFASLRERAGWHERLVVSDQAAATPLSLWRQLQLSCSETTGDERAEREPAAGETPRSETSGAQPSINRALPGGIRVAVNQVFASADHPLADGDELAFLPPISGG